MAWKIVYIISPFVNSIVRAIRLTRFKFIHLYLFNFIMERFYYSLWSVRRNLFFFFSILYSTQTYLNDWFYFPSSVNLLVKNSLSPYQFHSGTSWTSIGCSLPPPPPAKFFNAGGKKDTTNGGCDRGRWPRSGWSLSGRFLWGMNPAMEEELGILRGAVMCVSASEGCVRASTWRTIVLHPPRETENVSRLTELKQRVGHVVREGQPLSSRSTRFCFSLCLSSSSIVPSVSSSFLALSRDITYDK